MMKRAAAFLLVVVGAVTPALAQTAQRYMVATTPPARQAAVAYIPDGGERDRRDVRTFSVVRAFAVTLSAEEVAELRRSPDVRYVEPVVERQALGTGTAGVATDASSFQLKQTVPYGIDLVRARELWGLTRGQTALHVAVLDTGLDYDHPDLKLNYAGGFNTFTGTDDPKDDNLHGTHVTGTIAALDNTFGVVGVAPEAKIWAVKVLDKTGFGSTENIVAGVDYVVRQKSSTQGNWIMSLSLGSAQASEIEREAFARAADAGILIIAAAGNNGLPAVSYPAAYPSVVAVGAVDSERNLAGFSSWGPNLTIVGPGVSVMSTMPVGSVAVGEVQPTTESVMYGGALQGSTKGEIRARFVFCGLGKPEEMPASIRGKIAVMRRGEITFNEKTRNALAAGAAGVVIINRNDDTADIAKWTLILTLCDNTGCKAREEDLRFWWPVTVGISFSDGQQLLSRTGDDVISIRSASEDYARLSGTSMATPHVSGVAALVWSLAPRATAGQIRTAFLQTAADLGATGFDTKYGYGLIDAVTAARLLAPEKFGLPAAPAPPPPPTAGRRRSAR